MIQEYSPDRFNDLWDIYRDCFEMNCPKSMFKESVDRGITLLHGNDYFTYAGLISFIDEGEPWVWAVFTHQYHQGQGLGTQLLKEIERRYPDHKKINLFVGVNNPAQKLYYDLGYRATRVVRDIYPEEDAIRMTKELK